MAQIPEVDLLKSAVQRGVQKKAKPPVPALGKLLVVFVIALVIAGVAFSYRIIRSSSLILASGDAGVSGFFTQVKYLVTNADRPILGETDDRVNVLLLGMGGSGHQGAYLTDTIIVASIRPSTGEVAMLSIPRDLYVPIPDYGWRKINNANAFGQTGDYPGGGEALASAIVQEVTGLTIPYYARVDFEAFRKLIDLVGGVKVTIDQSFTDYQYPDYNYGYQAVSFTSGEETLSGERALQFVRSRKGTNGEGSDFARAKRQQKVITGMKEQLFSLGTILNPNKIIDIADSLGNHIRTNLEPWEMLRLAQLVRETTEDKIITKIIDNSSTGLLTAETTIDGAYILRPRSNDFAEIRALAADIFILGFVGREEAKIEVQNGTTIPGLAQSVADRLAGQDYTVVAFGNAVRRDAEQTTIYDLTNGGKPHSLMSLRLELDANVSTVLPSFLLSVETPPTALQNASVLIPSTEALPIPEAADVDFLIVLGSDQRTDGTVDRVAGR